MHYSKYIIILHLLMGCYALDVEINITQAFFDNEVVPNIEEEAPTQLIQVQYPSVEVKLGNTVSPLFTLTEPNVTFTADSDKMYTLAFFGPDLPIDLTPRYTQLLHWLVVNIQGSNITSGDTVAAYVPPVPYPGGFKYMYFTYQQNATIDAESLESYNLLRPHFDIVEFKKAHNLTGPIAGNFMREAYVTPLGI